MLRGRVTLRRYAARAERGNPSGGPCVEPEPPPTQEIAIPPFQQQVDTLVTLGYPALAGLAEPAFREVVEPLREQ